MIPMTNNTNNNYDSHSLSLLVNKNEREYYRLNAEKYA